MLRHHRQKVVDIPHGKFLLLGQFMVEVRHAHGERQRRQNRGDLLKFGDGCLHHHVVVHPRAPGLFAPGVEKIFRAAEVVDREEMR